MSIYIYILVMAVTTYLIRALPLTTKMQRLSARQGRSSRVSNTVRHLAKS